jgi:hypothetical protein
MPSLAHEIAVARLARDPTLLSSLAEKLGKPPPAGHRLADSTVRFVDPIEVRPDLILAHGKRGPWDAIEVQLRRDSRKARRWGVLVGALNAGLLVPEIQASKAARRALVGLQSAVAAATAAQSRKATLAGSLATTAKTLRADYTVAGTSLRAFEKTVDAVADGEAAKINGAGLVSTEDQPVTLAIPRKVTGLRGKPGQRASETMLSWDCARGATGYAVQVNVRPADAAAWSKPVTGNRRAYRLVKGPQPGAQILVRVAALGRDGVMAEWSDPVLVTTC